MKLRWHHLAAAAAAFVALAACTAVLAQPRADASRLDYRLQARALAPGVWVVEGDNEDFSVANGCNIINTGFIATGSGVLVINTGTSRRYGEQLRALIARTTPEPVAQVLHLNLHPDYFLGNQAFADVPRLATPVTRAGMAREAGAYETNLYRLCGDWMKGTEALLPDRDLQVPADGRWRLGSREFELHEWQGHTASDLVLVDRSSGVVFAGGLVFAQNAGGTSYSVPIQTLLFFTALSFLPAVLLLMTGFTRIVIVLSLLRQALGTPAAPPNQVIVGLSLFLTFFVMAPTLDRIYTQAYEPYSKNEIPFTEALSRGEKPLREFMLKQTRQGDVQLFAKMAKLPAEVKGEDVPLRVLVPAFVTSELKSAFQIGFLIFIPFLVIDMIVASVLMSLGMMMLSPVLVALPFKLMLFVLADGWNLLLGSLAASFAT